MKKRESKATPAPGEKEREKLKLSATSALDRIIEIAESESTDTKARIDAYKWLCEMYYGKPQSAHSEPESERMLHLSFEGDLDKWSS